MATFPEPKIVTDVAEIAEKIRFARPNDGSLGKVVFLIGAGCSISARIPGAPDIAKKMVQVAAHCFGYCDQNADPVKAYECFIEYQSLCSCLKADATDPLGDESIDWYRVYDEMFRRHYTAPNDVRNLFSRIMIEAGGAINWAHLCLGELVAQKFVSTVLTTNFDQLVLTGMVHAGEIPVVSDGLESLNRIAGAPRHPQLLELHGSRHTYLLRNSPEHVKAMSEDPQAKAAIQKLFQHATTFVAVGYGGREEVVMDLLIQAARVYYDTNLYWVDYSRNPKTISEKVREFLATSRNSGLFLNQDADRFFLDLCQSLNIGPPSAISLPLKSVEAAIKCISASKVEDPDIQEELRVAQERVNRLKRSDKRSQKRDPLAATRSAIRRKRLVGDSAEAYRLAKKELDG
jgi:hypothetical protein